MFLRQKVFAIIATVIFLLFIIELVRRKKMREEYSFLWVLSAVFMLILVLWYKPLLFLTGLIGAIAPTTTLFIFAIFFLMIISINFSIVISSLTERMVKLTQEFALLKSEMKEQNRKE
jgi:hypothetical protein